MDRILLVFLSTIGVAFARSYPTQERCRGSADVVFVLDESSSIDRDDFKEQLAFVQGLVGDFNVGSGGIHVGVITFATNVRVDIPLAEYTNEDRLKEEIAQINQEGGSTYTNLALKRLRQEMSQSKSARPGVRHIAIIITDGQSTRPDDTKTEAKTCHIEHPDYEMFAIGVGNNASKEELEEIASSKNRVFTVATYKDLESHLRKIVASETCNKRCRGSADVVFVLDESGSIDASDFEKQLTFVQGLVGDFNVGSGGIHVGVITFSTDVKVAIPLGEYTDEDRLKEDIAKISQEGGSTYTDRALERLRQEMSHSKSNRPGVRHIAIIITDGQSTEPAKTKTEAEICHIEHPDYEMFAIGVGNSVSRQELDDIASSKNRVFTVDAFGDLESHLRKTVASETCNSRCRGSADVVFVLDESGSIDASDFEKQLTFVRGLVGDFNVGSGGIHVGVITFSTDVKVAIPLGEYTDEDRLKEDIAKISQEGGSTYTDRALERLRQEMSHSKSNRPVVRHIAIIITDGQSTEPAKTKTEAEICHIEHPDYEMFAIGVGNSVSRQELDDIASSKNRVFTVDAFGDLESHLRKTVASETCNSRCRGSADVVFVLDESGSIDASDFEKQLTFVRGLVGDFNVGSGGIHVGVITFSTDVKVAIPLGEYTDEDRLKEDIAKISQEGGSTYTDRALERLRQEMSHSKSTRPGVRHIAIIITDGQSTEPAKTKTEAEICHIEHPDYEMFAIGVGNSVSKQELEEIASSKNRVFTVDAFGDLESHLRKIVASETCKTPVPPPVTLRPTTLTETCRRYAYKKIDLIWSISVRADAVERNYALEFINWIIMELQKWSVHVQVGLTPRLCYGEDAIVLNGYDTIVGFWRELEQSRLAAVHSDRVIEYIRLQGFGGSVDAIRFGILIVDNTEVDWENTVNEARLAREEGIRLIVIGVGSRVDPGKLGGLAWSRDDYFPVSCYAELTAIKISIIQRICVEPAQSVWRKNLLESLYDF